MGLILGGRDVPCKVDILDHVSCPEMAIPLWQGCKPRRQSINLIVLHWTAGEGDAPAVRSTLVVRKCSAHFVIDRQGSIWQLLDPLEVEAFHVANRQTKGVNARSIGIEVVNYGMAPRWPGRIPTRGLDREVRQVPIQGRERSVADFYEPQVAAAITLVDVITDALPGIPRWLPTSGGELITQRLPDRLARVTVGIAGHYHFSGKCDPGPRLLQSIADHLAEQDTKP
jgi:hypothetical protein